MAKKRNFRRNPTKIISCYTEDDCPAESFCPTADIDMRNVCMCITNLIPATKDAPCTDTNNTTLSDDKHNGVIPLERFQPHHIEPFANNNTSRNDSQTITSVPDHGTMTQDETLDIALKVFVPLAGTLVLSIIVVVILLRHFRACRQKKKRGKNSSSVKASEDIQLLDRMNNVNKNPVYFGTKATGILRKSHVTDIPMERIKLMEVVGEGAFGQVFKGLLSHADEGEADIHIAVKVLKDGVSNEAREDFEREVEIMSAFDHDNILKLLGVVANNGSDTPYMIFEYMLYGDLAELLRKNDSSVRAEEATVKLQKCNLIDITTQIANGMKYLTSQHFVHRDLATRNCLVGEGLVVKISDFGMSRDIYTCDYYRIGGSRMLPVRWMSPEAVKWGRFTSESDIWAFGVVLWEIFSYGRQPYYGHTNEEVIRFLDEGILLQRPEECPSVVYHVMLQCWKLDPKERLHFDRIHKYLVEYNKQQSNNVHNSSLEHVNEYEIPL